MKTITEADFTHFATQSFLTCAGFLEEMEIISVVDRENFEYSYENSEMAKEMADAIVKVIERYRLSEVDEFFGESENDLMSEGSQILHEVQENGNSSSSQIILDGLGSSQTSGKI